MGLFVGLSIFQPIEKCVNLLFIKKILHLSMADGVGFEPTVGLPPRRFSRPVPSTARPPVRVSRSLLIASLFQSFKNPACRCHAGIIEIVSRCRVEIYGLRRHVGARAAYRISVAIIASRASARALRMRDFRPVIIGSCRYKGLVNGRSGGQRSFFAGQIIRAECRGIAHRLDPYISCAAGERQE